MENRKEDIIIELGSEWVRVGLVSDRLPRKSFESKELGTFRSDIPLQEYELTVEETLYRIFYSYINSSCLNKTVVILERVYTDRRIVEAMAKILFRKFKIDKLEFALSCVTPLYLSGRYSGLVVSAGASAVEMMPIYESYPLIHSFRNVPTGGQAMCKLIKDEIILQSQEIKPQVLQKLTPEYMAELRNNYSNMNSVQAKSEDIVSFSFKKSKLKLKPSNITYSNLYGDAANEEYNIAHAFLEVLASVPQEMLAAVAGNIVLAGGLWRVKGMQNYFKKQVSAQISQFPSLQKASIKQKLKFVNWTFNPSDVAWAGCSAGCSIRSVEQLCLKRVDYEKSGFVEKIMENYFLSD